MNSNNYRSTTCSYNQRSQQKQQQ